MFTAFSRILRAIHIIPPIKVDPVRRRATDQRGATSTPRTAEPINKVLGVNRDDPKRDERKIEPAMAGIPRDAVQRTPPAAASPGLPPVDPVIDPGAARPGTAERQLPKTLEEAVGAPSMTSTKAKPIKRRRTNRATKDGVQVAADNRS